MMTLQIAYCRLQIANSTAITSRDPQGACTRTHLSGAIRNDPPSLRTPYSEIRNSSGFAYIALLVVMVIIGISLGAAGKYWQNVVLRDKEEELLFRGDQYRQAIERYYFAVPGRPQYPKSIEDLLADSRTPSGKRHLRKKYQDPISGEDFEIITTHTITAGVPIPAPPGVVPGIIGVHSKSDREPLKKGNFPDQYPDFAGKGAYHDWRFVSTIKAGPPGVPGRLPIPRPPGQIR